MGENARIKHTHTHTHTHTHSHTHTHTHTHLHTHTHTHLHTHTHTHTHSNISLSAQCQVQMNRLFFEMQHLLAPLTETCDQTTLALDRQVCVVVWLCSVLCCVCVCV